MIWGAPEIGKSAFLSYLVNYDGAETGDYNCELLNWKRLIYFASNSEQGKPIFFLKNIVSRICQLFKINIDYKDDVYSLSNTLAEIFKIISNKNQKLLLFIDGLDETIPVSGFDFIDVIPQSVPEGIVILLSSRHNKNINLKLKQVNFQIQLSGLKKNDILAILSKSINKYKLLENENIINEILKRSKGYNDENLGNPLYINQLLRSIENEEIDIFNLDTILNGLKEFYDRIISNIYNLKYNSPEELETVLQILFILSASPGPINRYQISYFTGFNVSAIEKGIHILYDILYEEKQDEFYHYRLYHKSFCDFLEDKFPLEISKAKNQICAECQNWKQEYDKYQTTNAPQNLENLKYIFKYYIISLSNFKIDKNINKILSKIESLIYDTYYLEKQFAITKDINIILEDINTYLKIVNEANDRKQYLARYIKACFHYSNVKMNLGNKLMENIQIDSTMTKKDILNFIPLINNKQKYYFLLHSIISSPNLDDNFYDFIIQEYSKLTKLSFLTGELNLVKNLLFSKQLALNDKKTTELYRFFTDDNLQ